MFDLILPLFIISSFVYAIGIIIQVNRKELQVPDLKDDT